MRYKSVALVMLILGCSFVLAQPYPKFAYVANFLDGTISIYVADPETGQLQANGYVPSGGTSPNALITDRAGTFLFVANFGSSNISAYTIDSDSGRLAAVNGSPFAAGNGAYALAMADSSNGRYLYAVNAGSNDLSVFSIGANGALTELAGSPYVVGDEPTSIALHPSGQFAYVTCFNENTIVRVNLNATTGEVVSTEVQAEPLLPFFAALHPDGYLYVASFGFNFISAYEVSTTLTEIPGSPYPAGANPKSISIDPSGRYLYAANISSNNVSAFTIEAGGWLSAMNPASYAAGLAPGDVEVDPTGRFVYIPNRDSDTVSVYSISTTTGVLNLQATLTGRDGPFAITFVQASEPSAYRTKFVYAANDHNVSAYKLNSITGFLQPIASAPFYRAWGLAPDVSGSRLYGSDHLSDDIDAYRVELDGSLSLTESRSGGLSPTALTTEPSGRFLYAANDSSNTVSGYETSRFLPSLPGSPYTAQARPMASVADPAGRHLFVANFDSDNISAYNINQATGALTSVSVSPFAAGNGPLDIDIDSTGRFVYVGNAVSGDISAYTINTNTGALTPVTGSPFVTGLGNVLSIAIHPSGNILYATSGNNGQPNLAVYTINPADGSLLNSVISQLSSVAYPLSADPSGRFLYTTQQDAVSTFRIHEDNSSLDFLSSSPFSFQVGSLVSIAGLGGFESLALYDIFEDGNLDSWTHPKPGWSENSGSLRATTTAKTAIFRDNFTCYTCTIETRVRFENPGARVSLLLWYQDKKNYLEFRISEDKDQLLLIYRHNGVRVAKSRRGQSIEPNVDYDISATYDGEFFTVYFNHAEFAGTSAVVPEQGGFGIRVKATNHRNVSVSIPKIQAWTD